jgi:hypothetical protein
MTRETYPSFFALVVALCLVGCADPGPTPKMAPKSDGIEVGQMPILASVLTHLGDMYPAVHAYWLDVGEVEFSWLERHFESQRPRFRYAWLRGADPTGVGDILYVRWIDGTSKGATARAGCRGKGYFAEYLLRLVFEQGVWKVTSCELICVS